MNMRSKSLVAILLSLVLTAAPTFAQSPNTGAMTVVVVDQNGSAVKDAKVSVLNAATAAAREVNTGDNGSVTIPALSLTGNYTLKVSKDGFTNEERKDIVLRSARPLRCR